MDARVGGGGATEVQGVGPPRSAVVPSSSSSSSSTTKKISFAFGKKSSQQSTGQTNSSTSSAAVAATSRPPPFPSSSTPDLASFSSRLSSSKGFSGSDGRLSRYAAATTTSAAAAAAAGARAAPVKEVLSIFCSTDDSSDDRSSKATQQVLSFDKYSGWEEKVDESAGRNKAKGPLVIPCPHRLSPPRRGTSKQNSKSNTELLTAVPRGAAAAGLTSAGGARDEATAAAAAADRRDPTTASAEDEDKASGVAESAAAPPRRGGEVAAAAAPDARRERATREGDGEAATAEKTADKLSLALLEPGRCEDVAENTGEKGIDEITCVREAAAGREVSSATGAGQQQGTGNPDSGKAEQSRGELLGKQPEQGEGRKTRVLYGLITPVAAPRHAGALADEKGLQSEVSSRSASLFFSSTASATPSSRQRGRSPAAAAAAAAAAECGADAKAVDADELAAQALIAEARGDYAAAAAAAWGAAGGGANAVPILARNTELAALRRRFRQRLQAQPQQDMQQQQQEHSTQASSQAPKEQHQQQLPRVRRGRGASFYQGNDVPSGVSGPSSRDDGSRDTSFTSDPVGTDSIHSGNKCEATADVNPPSREDATAFAAGANAGLSSRAGPTSSGAASTAATGDAAAAGGIRETRDIYANGGGFRRSTSAQRQQQPSLSREEAEKELLRQELDLLPDAPLAHSAAYAAVPVSEFGIAMLRGMGYDPATAAAAKTAGAGEDEKKTASRRTYTRAGLGSEAEVERLWKERKMDSKKTR